MEQWRHHPQAQQCGRALRGRRLSHSNLKAQLLDLLTWKTRKKKYFLEYSAQPPDSKSGFNARIKPSTWVTFAHNRIRSTKWFESFCSKRQRMCPVESVLTFGTATGFKLPEEISLITSREIWTLKYYLKIGENASHKSPSASPHLFSSMCSAHRELLSGVPVNSLPT